MEIESRYKGDVVTSSKAIKYRNTPTIKMILTHRQRRPVQGLRNVTARPLEAMLHKLLPPLSLPKHYQSGVNKS